MQNVTWPAIIAIASNDGLTLSGGPSDWSAFLVQLNDQCVQGIETSFGVPIKDLDYTFMQISAACGCKRRYKTIDDVPLENVICEHGNSMIVWA